MPVDEGKNNTPLASSTAQKLEHRVIRLHPLCSLYGPKGY